MVNDRHSGEHWGNAGVEKLGRDRTVRTAEAWSGRLGKAGNGEV